MSLAPTSTCWPPISIVFTAPPRNSSAKDGTASAANRAAPSAIDESFMMSSKWIQRRLLAVRRLINTGCAALFPARGKIVRKGRIGGIRSVLDSGAPSWFKQNVWGNWGAETRRRLGRWLSRNKTKNSGACHLSGRTLVKRREFFKSATALTAGAAATAALATP